jgi:hypothetical protein
VLRAQEELGAIELGRARIVVLDPDALRGRRSGGGGI